MIIEQGRFSKPPVPADNKVCDHCLTDIEDEFHFVIKCTIYDVIRNHFFSSSEALYELLFIRG